jgi:NAD(P) transhydrogenase subunit alpha
MKIWKQLVDTQKKHQEYKKKQAEMMKEALKKNDIVICTALIPGKPAPRILTEDL